jgi:hypothetical protein
MKKKKIGRENQAERSRPLFWVYMSKHRKTGRENQETEEEE